MLDLSRQRTRHLLALAFTLMLCGGVSIAQTSPQPASPQPAPTAPTDRAYTPPVPLSYNPPENVSSGEFQRYVATQSEQVSQKKPPLPKVPSGLISRDSSIQVAQPMEPGPVPPAPTVTAQPFDPLAPPASDAVSNPSNAISVPDPSIPTEIPVLEEVPQAPIQKKSGPWWEESCRARLLADAPQTVCQADLEQLIWQSMQYSPRVQSILIVPKIQRTEEQIASGSFDPTRYAQTNYHNTSDPVGNTLTTGGPSRLNEEFWENSAGIRDRNILGGKSDLSQAFNARDNNSLFFKPNNQADTKMSLNYTQPLLRGAGSFYNTSSIRLAGIKTRATIATANRELQDHAMNIITAYWELTLHRYLLLQAMNGQVRLQGIKAKLMDREGIDLLPSHLSRANAAIAGQQGQIEIAKANIKAREATLRQLVNSPELESGSCREIIPLTLPTDELPKVPIEDELSSAIMYRGDIQAIQQSIESATVQQRLAVNELRPTLDLIASSYIRGLRGENDFNRAFASQFDTGRPSFSSGLEFQNPVGNRAAKANLQGRALEVAKLMNDYSNALLNARKEIESAVEASKGTYASALAAIEQTFASKEEVELQMARFYDAFGDNPSLSNILNDLLDAENRLITAENTWASRQIQHMQAIAQIKYEAGTLMTISAE